MNEAYLVPTIFTDINPITNKLVEANYGFRLFDNYGKSYTNLLSKKQFEIYIKLNPKEILKDLFILDDNARVIFEYARKKGGIIYGDNFVKFE